MTSTYDTLIDATSEDFHSLHSATNIVNVIRIKEDETGEI
jgi:hypothetical protein